MGSRAVVWVEGHNNPGAVRLRESQQLETDPILRHRVRDKDHGTDKGHWCLLGRTDCSKDPVAGVSEMDGVVDKVFSGWKEI